MSYIIAFKDKSKLQVEDETAKTLMDAILGGQLQHFELGGEMYSVSGVDKIISKDKAFDIFPSEWELLKGMVSIKPQQTQEEKVEVLQQLTQGNKLNAPTTKF